MELRGYKKTDIKKGTRVLMRIDANVPVVRGRVQEGSHGRIAQTLPDIRALVSRGARVVLVSHLGRPDGRSKADMSVKPVAARIGRDLGMRIVVAPGVAGAAVERTVSEMKNGSVLMLENVRYDAREEKNSAAFAKELARLADVYVNDAFGVCHRKHASVHAITRYLPSFAGPLLQREVRELSHPFEKPFILVMGGIKLETKLPVIARLASKSNAVLVGGGIAVPLLAARFGLALSLGGKAIAHTEFLQAKRVLNQFGEMLILPIDMRVVRGDRVREVSVRELQKSDEILDVGTHTEELFRRMLIGAGSVVWNGAMGVVEHRHGKKGSISLAKAIVAQRGARSIVGGGDTVAFLEGQKLAGRFSTVSTGGGAMLAFLGGESLPGIEPLIKHR